MKRIERKSLVFLLLFIVTGAILGGIIGEIMAGSQLLAGLAPYLAKPYPVFDMAPMIINLSVVEITIGFKLHPNLISIMGILAGIYLFKKF